MTEGLERWYGGQRRYYDFNVRIEEKRVEKLRYMHRNPVERELVSAPEDWNWNSFNAYACKQEHLMRVNCQEWPLIVSYPLRAPTDSKIANEWGTRPH